MLGPYPFLLHPSPFLPWPLLLEDTPTAFICFFS